MKQNDEICRNKKRMLDIFQQMLSHEITRKHSHVLGNFFAETSCS